MHRMAVLSVCLIAVAPLPVWAGDGASDSERVETMVEENRSLRQREAVRTELFTPFFTVKGHDSTELILVSGVNDPIEIEVTAFSPSGELLPLGSHTILPSRHLSLNLKEILLGENEAFREGSLRVSFLGTATDLQAWTIVQVKGRALGFTLAAPSKVGGTSLLTFWGARKDAYIELRSFYVLNAGPRPIHYSLTTSHKPEPASQENGRIDPGERRVFRSPVADAGWMRVNHDGNPGDLIGMALSRGPRDLDSLPVSALPGDNAREWEAIHVPINGDGDSGELGLTLMNTAEEQVEVEVSVLSVQGRGLSTQVVTISGRSLIDMILPHQVLGSVGNEGRVRVSADRSGVLVQGRSASVAGEYVELSFFDLRTAHASGSYPILPLARYGSTLTLVNLGREAAQVVAQAYWRDGTYALGPFVVAGGSSRSVSIDDVVEGGEPDLLGRRLPRVLPAGFFKWKVHSGSRTLLGRMEANARGSGERVGFNCLGCCWESPWGSIEPSYVEFNVGQSPAFVACVNYQTCNGVMGPYETNPTSMTVPSPFSWNSLVVSASSSAEETLSFLAWGEEVASTCNTISAPYGSSGIASTCRILLRKTSNPASSWSASEACNQQASNCSQCSECCSAQRAYWTCKKRNSSLVQHEYEACMGHCVTDHCS